MKRFNSLLFSLLVAISCASAADPNMAVGGKEASSHSRGGAFAKPAISNKVSEEARRCADAMVSQNFTTLAKYTHPKVIEMLGGEAGMVERMTAEVSRMREEGFRIASATIGDAEEPRTVGGKMISMVPQTVVIMGPGVKITQEGTLLGVSTNGGDTWVFVDLAVINEAQFAQVFPDLAGDVKLPDKKQPTVEKLP